MFDIPVYKKEDRMLTKAIIKQHHSYQLHTKCYPSFFSQVYTCMWCTTILQMRFWELSQGSGGGSTTITFSLEEMPLTKFWCS